MKEETPKPLAGGFPASSFAPVEESCGGCAEEKAKQAKAEKDSEAKAEKPKP